MAEAKQAFASLETGVHEMCIDWSMLEGGLVSCTVSLEFPGGGKRQYKVDTALAGVGDDIVDAK